MSQWWVSRRGALLGSAGVLVAGCGGEERAPRPTPSPTALPTPDGRTPQHPPAQGVTPEVSAPIFYGQESAEQFGLLVAPVGEPRGLVVMVHGGGWAEDYSVTDSGFVASAVASAGYLVWTLEYRRLGAGGGGLTTLTDVAAGVDHLAQLAGEYDEVRELMDRVVFMGESAGAHLAVWAASRTADTPGGRSEVTPKGVVSLAGPLTLTALAGQPGALGSAIQAFLGGTPSQVPEVYRLADPVRLLPAVAPVFAVHGIQDPLVPFAASQEYVAASRRAGGKASFVPVDATHQSIVDVTRPSWQRVLVVLEDILV